MSHLLCSWRAAWIVWWPVGGGRLFLTLLLLLGSSWASAADAPANEKADSKESLLQLRAYLPALRCKALLDDERQSVAELEKLLQLSQAFVEVELAHRVQAGQVEETLLRSRLRLLRRETDYQDSLEEFTHRFKIPAPRRQEMEDAAILPLANLLRRFEKLLSDSEKAEITALELGPDKDVAKVRPALVKLLTTSALVSDTTLPKRFRKEWEEWEKLKDIEKVSKKLLETNSELSKLRRARLKEGERPHPSDKVPQPDEYALFFASAVGRLQLQLRVYETQVPKEIRDIHQQETFRHKEFLSVVREFKILTLFAYGERFGHLAHSWPPLFPARLKAVDLISIEDGTAEETVARMLKTPEAQVNGKKKLRQLRALAKSYRLEQRLFVLGFTHRKQIQDAWLRPKSPPGTAPGELIGPVAELPPLPPSDISHLIDAYRSVSQARQRLLQTWIDYQMVRLDLYNDLGLSPSDR